MSQADYIDDLMLAAFVDGQLDPVNCESVLAAVEIDPDTRERLYQLRRAKDLMKMSFEHLEAPPLTRPAPKWRLSAGSGVGVAASLLVLTLGFGSGVLGFYCSERLANDPGNPPALAITPQPYKDRVVLHISESDPKQFDAALNYIEKFLDKNKTEGSQIEVIANSGGLDLMRTDTSPVKQQVIAMMRKHENVHFIACANGLRNLHKRGIDAPIIPDIDTDKTAIDHIIGRLHAGWTYVKVDNLPEI
jgi:intracellular sulfur oxidation DsrE/DsrF family protein